MQQRQVEMEIEAKAKREYSVETVVEKYMACIEEIINIPILLESLAVSVEQSKVVDIFDEILLQSDIEFNFESQG